MAKKEGVTEQLKSDDWLCWLQKMNSIRSRAEEIVLHDLVDTFCVMELSKTRDNVKTPAPPRLRRS